MPAESLTKFSLETLDGRHLILAYATVFLLQGGYVAWLAWNWFRTGASSALRSKSER